MSDPVARYLQTYGPPGPTDPVEAYNQKYRPSATKTALFSDRALLEDAQAAGANPLVVPGEPTPELVRGLQDTPRLSEKLSRPLDAAGLHAEAQAVEGVENFARGLVPGAVKGITQTAAMVEQGSRFLGAIGGANQPGFVPKPYDKTTGPVTRAAEAIERPVEEAFQPEGAAGAVGEIAGSFLPFMAAGAARRVKAARDVASVERFNRAVDEARGIAPKVAEVPKPTPNVSGKSALPAIGATGGGTAGGAVGYASADEDASPLEKGLRTAGGAIVGAGLGYAAGRGAEKIGEKLNTRGAAPSPVMDDIDRALDDLLTPEEKLGPSKMAELRRRQMPPGTTPEAYPSGPSDYHVQVNRLLADPSGEKAVAERVADLKATGEIAPKQRVTFGMMQDKAAKLDVDRIIAQPKNRALTGPEGMAIRNEYETVEALKAETIQRMQGLPEQSDEFKQLERGLRMMEGRQDALLTRFIPGASQQGRDFVALKAAAMNSNDPFSWERRVLQAKGTEGSISTAERVAIRDALQRGDKAALIKIVQDAEKPLTFGPEWLVLLRKSGLLSLSSVMKGVVGNAARAVHTEVTKPLTVLADKIVGMFTGVRTQPLTSVRGVRAGLKGFGRGMAQAPDVMRGGLSEIEILKAEIPRRINMAPIWGKSKWADAWTKFGFRMQAVADRPYSYAARDKALVELAWLHAKGDREMFTYLLANPTDEMVTLSSMEGVYATYQNETVLGNMGRGLKASARRGVNLGGVRVPGTMAGPAADFVAPFVGTPSAVVTQGIEATPAGLLATPFDVYRLAEAAKAGASRTEIAALQKVFTRRFGSAGTGLLAMLLGAKMVKDTDRLTGDWPESQSERDQWMREGKRPWSININGRWWGLGVLGPLGALVGFTKAYSDSEGFNEGLSSGVASTIKESTEQSYMQGVKEVIDVLDQRKSAGRMAESAVGSFIPTFASQAARAIDPTIRDPGNPIEAARARIPFASKGVQPMLDPFGREITREDNTLTRVARSFIDPFSSAPDRTDDDPVVREIGRVGASLTTRRKSKASNLPTEEDVRNLVATEGPELYRRLKQVVESPAYRNASNDEIKARILEAQISAVRRGSSGRLRAERLRSRPAMSQP